uniref:RHOMBOID-like protein n=1 Tax=Ananas comosus var. bracteatus TaxID=296719 RepID=A0A6V7PX40_ANACO|nr:unnamed protein product [Ananas comosus var. bracteatus]
MTIRAPPRSSTARCVPISTSRMAAAPLDPGTVTARRRGAARTALERRRRLSTTRRRRRRRRRRSGSGRRGRCRRSWWANVAVFAAAMYVNDCPRHPNPFGSCVAPFLRRFSFQPLRQNPLFGPSSATLEKLGGLEWNKVVHQHQGWRLVTCIWLHAGVIHLLANMLSLVFIGIRLEQQFGFIRIGAIYLLSGFGGSVLSALFIRNSISVGASGALFGLLGAMLSELFTNWTIYTNKAVALLTLLTIIAINLALGILPHVDNFAHIGGFLTGFLLGFILLIRPQFGWSARHNLPPGSEAKSKYMAYQCVLWFLL